MSNNGKYEKVPLTPAIAEGIILELFAEKDPVRRSDIIEKVINHYTKNGGLEPQGDKVSVFKKALSNLKNSGRVQNISPGYWKILPTDNRNVGKDPLSRTESKDEDIEELVESLLRVIKAEIHNLQEEIEALNRQKSHLEDNLAKFSRIWRAMSSK